VTAPALTLRDLRKRYERGGPWALDGLSCSFPRGAISGLVGPNGAGKTTLFSAVAGYLQLQGGTVDILGEGPFDPFRMKGRFGMLPQDATLDLRLTPTVFLRGMARLQGLGRDAAEAAAAVAIAAVNLSDRASDRVGSLSHGMRRRLAVASALVGEPELIVLDEPTAGLDPKEASSLRGVLMGLRGRASLIVSSHNLVELERICDHVVLIEAGRCLGQGTIEALTSRGVEETWTLGPGDVPLAALQAALPDHAFELVTQTLVHRAPTEQHLDAGSVVIAGQLAAAAVPIRGVRRGRSLEESYLERTR